MGFSEAVKIRALVACGRCCCLCHEYCGNNMEVHHIKAKADGGSDDYSNAIPLCFNCHAEVRQYDPKHPKGIRFTEAELIQHRDNWYKSIKVSGEKSKSKKEKTPLQPIKRHRQPGYENIVLRQIRTGKELMGIIRNSDALDYDVPEAASIEEAELFSETVQNISDWIDCLSSDTDPGESIMVGYRLNSVITELDNRGFFLFGAKENQSLTGGLIETSEPFPVVIIRIVRKEDPQIIKKNVAK